MSIVQCITVALSVLLLNAQSSIAKELALSDLMDPSEKPKKIAGDFRFTEGPSVDKQGNLYFSDIPNKTLYRWNRKDGLKQIRKGEQATNGTYINSKGEIVVCEVGGCRVLRIDQQGKESVIADNVNKRKLGHTNDIWVAPDGGIYFTIPNKTRIKKLVKQKVLMGTIIYVPANGDPARDVGKSIDIRSPNGVVGSSNGKQLYYTDRGRCWVATIQKDGSLKDKREAAPKGSDGLTLDEHGNLYTTGREGLTIFSPERRKIGIIPFPETPANLTFGGPEKRTLYVTARTSVYSLKLKVRGN